MFHVSPNNPTGDIIPQKVTLSALRIPPNETMTDSLND